MASTTDERLARARTNFPWWTPPLELTSTPPRRLVTTDLDWAALGSRQDWMLRAAAPLLELMRASPQPPVDVYEVTTTSDGEPIRAAIDNLVYRTSTAPAVENTTRLRQALLGIASVRPKNNGLVVALKYLQPFYAKHWFGPSKTGLLQERAARSIQLGTEVARVTLRLLSAGLGVPLEIVERRRDNQVCTAYLPYWIDLAALQHEHATCVETRKKFQHVVICHPSIVGKLLLFPKGTAISVGTQEASEMLASMRTWIPEFERVALDKQED